MTVDEYVRAVDQQLPRWLPERRSLVADVRSHLADRLETGASEAELTAQLEPPADYAAALVAHLRFEPAPHGRRIGAFLIDAALGIPVVIIVFLAMSLIMGVFVNGWPADMPRLWWHAVGPMITSSLLLLLVAIAGTLAASALVMSIVYFPVVEAVWGTTVGKKLMGLGVIAENGMRVGWLKAIVRRIPFYFEFFLLDAVFALFTRRRQRAFDLVSRTLVVRLP